MNPDNPNNNSGCLFPFGDDFLPIFMFFFHMNAPNPPEQQGEEDDEDDNDQIFFDK